MLSISYYIKRSEIDVDEVISLSSTIINSYLFR